MADSPNLPRLVIPRENQLLKRTGPSPLSADQQQKLLGDVNVGLILQKLLDANPDLSAPIAAIQALLEIIKHSKATTMSEFTETIKYASQLLKDATDHPIAVWAGCDLFMRFVNVTAHESTCKEMLLKSGQMVVEKATSQKLKIIKCAKDFIRDGSVLLIHSYSRVVMMVLEAALKQNKRFEVYCTESRPSGAGYRAKEQLDKLGIPCNLIMDSAVGYVIEKVDLVLVGAEGIVENGGLINSLGTYQIAMVSKTARKPFYAAAESFKFVRLFPLNQYDLPFYKDEIIKQSPPPSTQSFVEKRNNHLAAVDYTPPQFITLLLTDLGALTPSGVSDELIKLYY